MFLRVLRCRPHPGRAAAARAALRIQAQPPGLSVPDVEPLRERVLPPARGQPRRLPLAPCGGVAGGDDLRLAAPAPVGLVPSAVLPRSVGLTPLPSPSLRGGPSCRMCDCRPAPVA